MGRWGPEGRIERYSGASLERVGREMASLHRFTRQHRHT